MVTKQIARKLSNYAKDNAHLLKEDKSLGLVHGDFNGLNILMSGTDVSAILDWEFALSGSIYFDIGNMLRYEFQQLTHLNKDYMRG